MRRFLWVLALLSLLACLAACGKSDKIEGKVLDVFGAPISGATIKIAKSAFTANTDGSGNYILDYAPGSMQLIFSKPGYTTMTLDLNIQQKTHFPAEAIVLYPIPQEEGMYYLDMEGRRMVKIEANAQIEETQTNNPGFSLTMRYRFFARDNGVVSSIKPGNAVFIDKVPQLIQLATARENGLVYEGNLNMFEKSDMYSGFIKDTGQKVGQEQLLLRTFSNLGEGTYAWVRMVEAGMIGAIPQKNGQAYKFKVEGAPAR